MLHAYQPANIHVMRILRNAPPSNVVRTKSDKVSGHGVINRDHNSMRRFGESTD